MSVNKTQQTVKSSQHLTGATFVGVVFPCQLAECALDCIGVRTAVHPQHLEIILVSAAGHGV